VTTINRTPQSYLLAILAAEYVLKLVPQGTHNWEKFVKPSEIKEILEKSIYLKVSFFRDSQFCIKVLIF